MTAPPEPEGYVVLFWDSSSREWTPRVRENAHRALGAPTKIARIALFTKPASEPAKVECPNCGELTSESHEVVQSDGLEGGRRLFFYTCPRQEPAQPAPAVAMTREYRMVEDAAAARGLWHLDNGQRQQFNEIADCIAAVRAQAAEAGKVRMPKVRDALDLLRHRTCNTADVATLTDAIAELDAAEGKGKA